MVTVEEDRSARGVMGRIPLALQDLVVALWRRLVGFPREGRLLREFRPCGLDYGW